jgi:hypothetical protein
MRLAMLVVVLLPGAGCSGINTGTSVSPATFLLPGIMKTEPPKDGVSAKEFALNR